MPSFRTSLIVALLPISVISAGSNNQLVAQEEIPKGIVAQFPSILKGKPFEPLAGEDELRSLMKARYNAALGVTVDHWVKYARQRAIHCTSVVGCARRLMQAGMDLEQDPKERLVLVKQMLEFSDRLEAVVQREGNDDVLGLKEVLEFRVEVSIERVKVERALKAAPPK